MPCSEAKSKHAEQLQINNKRITMMKSVNTGLRWIMQASLSLLLVLALVACNDSDSDHANNSNNTSDSQHEQSAQVENKTLAEQPESTKQANQLKQTGQSAMAAMDDGAPNQKGAKTELQTRNEQLKQTLKKTLKTYDPANTSCTSLSVKQCTASKACILDQDNNKAYQCRDAANPCESGFVQAGADLEKSCTSKKGCAFSNASCFCPPGMTCICGGGKPAACSLNGIK
ncbi:MAG: hypothetical protein ACI8WB_004866 [Phenylobacterium sp.]|jgi:hypothetical protein